MKFIDTNLIEELLPFSKKVALGTFLIGTCLLLMYYYISHNSIILLSMFFMIASFFINSFVFIRLLIFWFSSIENRSKILKSLFLLVLNLPIAYFYIEIGLKIYSDSNAV